MNLNKSDLSKKSLGIHYKDTDSHPTILFEKNPLIIYSSFFNSSPIY